MRFHRVHGLALCAALAAVLPAAQGHFVVVDDFEALLLGPIDEQNGWQAVHDTSAVVVDPADLLNQVLAVETDSTHLYRSATVANETVRMMFLRFRYAAQLSISWGLSDSAHPDQFGEFEVELSLTNANSELRMNDDGTYETLTVLQPNTWYNAWILVDNSADGSQVWLHDRPGARAYAADQLDAEGQTFFVFRDGTAGNLVTFYIKTGGGSGVAGPLYLDDIYIEDTDALNLFNPTVSRVPGDLNCDGAVDFADINAFVTALIHPSDYAVTYPDCNPLNGDLNHDGALDFGDINPFVDLLLSGE